MATSARLERLTQLQASVQKWADNRREKIQKIIDSHKKMLKSRGSTASRASEAAESIVVDEITDFLS